MRERLQDEREAELRRRRVHVVGRAHRPRLGKRDSRPGEERSRHEVAAVDLDVLRRRQLRHDRRVGRQREQVERPRGPLHLGVDEHAFRPEHRGGLRVGVERVHDERAPELMGGTGDGTRDVHLARGERRHVAVPAEVAREQERVTRAGSG